LVCLIALDWRLAAAVGADGVHVPERGAAAGALLWRRQHKGLLTMAAHSTRAITRATRLGADAIILAPVFATASHPTAQTLGALRFAALTRATSRPVIALGGISDTNVARLAHTRVHGFAAIGGLAGN
jgi:thiamine-phosphate pyrophosphorylase